MKSERFHLGQGAAAHEQRQEGGDQGDRLALFRPGLGVSVVGTGRRDKAGGTIDSAGTGPLANGRLLKSKLKAHHRPSALLRRILHNFPGNSSFDALEDSSISFRANDKNDGS